MIFVDIQGSNDGEGDRYGHQPSSQRNDEPSEDGIAIWSSPGAMSAFFFFFFKDGET
jgi:hypothetical protein